ncbi:cache domain-containing sensor histidine kinase [Paenibacillus eucommiae]|uniref:Sensor histidine kinase YesM n=1 Tax=Paenibacillus eucommiae TaxID=1355755 RepID=A0ABS4IS85_9BACL|nr:sensor histidine kinase [Paenibacillus eucommiae]MBP1990432.1 sensor histidine kinase YesM [Paenibacillus eucommiae]
MTKPPTIRFTHFLMLFSLSVTTILLLIIGTVLYSKTKHILVEKINLIHSMKLNQASADVRKQFEDLYKSFDGFRSHELLIDSVRKLSNSRTSSYERFTVTKNLQTAITNFKIGNASIEHVMVMTQQQQFSSNLKYVEYFLDGNRLPLHLDQDQIVFVPPGRTYALFQLDRNRIDNPLLIDMIDPLEGSMYFVCRLNDTNGEQIGLMFMLLSASALKTQIPYADSLAIIGEDGKLLYRGDGVDAGFPQQLRKGGRLEAQTLSLHGQRYEIRPLGFNGFRLVFVEPEIDFHRSQIRIIAWYSILTLLGSALLSYIFSRWIGKNILRPLHGLIRWIRGFERLEDRWDAGNGWSGNTRITTMRERFFVYFLLTILLPILLFVMLFYIQSTRVVSKEVQQTYSVLFEKSAHRLELFVKQKESALTWLAYNAWVAEYVEDPGEENRGKMDDLLVTGTYSSLSEDIVSLYDVRNRLIYTNRHKQAPRMDVSLYESMMTMRKNMHYWLPPAETGSSTVSLSMAVVNIQISSEPLGFLKADVSGVFLSSLYAELNGNGSEAFVVDQEGRILSHPEVEKVGQMSKLPASPGELNAFTQGNPAVQYFSSKLSGLPWYLVTVFDATTVRKQAIGLIYDDIYLFIIIFLLILLASYLMSQYLIRPLSSLQWKVARRDLDPEGSFSWDAHYAIDEVEQLRASFNLLMEQIGQLVEEKLKAKNELLLLEYEKKGTQLEALQAQINPHFLHNTLEIVMYMIEKGERESAVTMIGLLSRLFRYAMGKESQVTSLRDEVAYAKTYMRIMSFRYKDKIRCKWQIDEEMLNCAVVKMILQPLQENAIRHTLQSGADQVHISISIDREGSDLRIAVTDNGPWLADEKLAAIQDNLKRRDRSKVGLYNVNSRIQLHFGEKYGITMNRAVPHGATVVLKLPYAQVASVEADTNM